MDIYFTETDYGKSDTLYGTEFDISNRNSITNDVDIQEERVLLLDDQVDLFDVSTRQVYGNESLDILNALHKYKEMKIKYSKALKSNEILKCEVLSGQNCIHVLKTEIKNLNDCKEHLENKMERLYLSTTLANIDQSIVSVEDSTLPHEGHFGRDVHETLHYDQKLMKTFCNSKYLELQRHKQPHNHGSTNANPYVIEKSTQCSNISFDDLSSRRGTCLKSSETQTDMVDNLNEFSSLIDLLNDVTSKYNNLCLEKAVLERNLMHVISEKQIESSKVAKEREIRQKCLDKMTKLIEERDAAVAEHKLVMSERDVVHKEIDQLQDQLNEQTIKLDEARKRIDYLERSRRTQTEEDSTEEERVMLEFDQILDDTHPSGNQSGRPVPHGDHVTPDGGDHLVAASAWMQNNFKENDSLKRQLQQTISEFAKRDKIVKERDSMRMMCDRLRQDRDSTVNELIRAKKESDEMKKQRNQAFCDLKTFKEMYVSNASNNQQSRMVDDESICHSYSKDSAIDSDFQEWETEFINLDVGSDSIGNLGFELAGGCREGQPGQHVYIKNILSCSPAYGIIQVNDQIMQINSVDVTRADKSFVCQLIRQSPRPINMLIKRKKSCTKLYPAASQVLPAALHHQPKNSKLDLPPLPLPIGGSIARQQLRNTISCSTNPISCSTNTYKSAPEESGSCSGSEKVREEADDDVCDGTLRNGEHSKERKNILNKAFMVLSKPFKHIPKDGRSKSTANQPNISLLAKEDVRMWSSKHNPYRETWPKCHRHSSTGKKVRPRLNLEMAVKDGSTAGQDESKDANPSTKNFKSSFTFHYVQMSDPSSDSKGQLRPSGTDDLGNERDDRDVDDIDDSKRASASSSFQTNPSKVTEDQPDPETINLIDFNDEITIHNHKPITSSPPADTITNSRLQTIEDNQNNFREPFTDSNSSNSSKRQNTENRAMAETSDRNPLLGSFPIESSKMSTRHDVLNSPVRSCHFSFDTERRDVFDEDELWKNPPAHQVLRAVEERVSGTTHCQQGKDLSSYLLHRCGTAGMSRKVCPNNTALKICLNQGGTRTLPHLNSQHCHNAKKSSIFSAYNSDHSYGSFMSNVTDHSPINYNSNNNQPINYNQSINQPINQSPGMYIDRLANGSFPAFISRLERHRLFHSPPSIPIFSPSHTSTSMTPLNSNTTPDLESPFSRPFQEFVSPSKSDALLDVKQKFLRRQEVDFIGDIYHQNSRKFFGSRASRGNYGILDDSTNSAMSSLRNVQISRDASSSSLLHGTRAPNAAHVSHHRCQNKHHTLPAMTSHWGDFAMSGTLTTPVHNSLPNSSDFHEDASMNSFMDFNEVSKNISISGLYTRNTARKTRNVNSSASSSTNPMQRNSEPADFNVESVCPEMQTSSMSDGGLIYKSHFKTSEPFGDFPADDTSNKFNEQAVDVASNRNEDDPDDDDVDNPDDDVDNPDDDAENPDDDADNPGQNDNVFIDLSNEIDRSQSTTESETESTVRQISIVKKSAESLKIDVAGGNAVGIFVREVSEDSSVAGPRGLKVGDRILKYNGISFHDTILEEAILEMNKPCEQVRMQVQYSPDVYKRIQNHPCDCLYVRALFDHPSNTSGELSFSKDDVLFVDSTYYNNKIGMWRAYLIDGEGLKTKCGTVVSRMNRPTDNSIGGHFFDWKSPPHPGTSNGSMRRSFFKRRKHQTRDDISPSESSEPDLHGCIPDDEFYGLYERVEKLDTYLSRPVLIVGTFANQIIAKLSKDFPYKFYRFMPEFGRRKCDNGSITYETETGGIASIPISLLKNSMASHHHSLTNFPVDLANKFLVHKIHFIVILIKYKSYKQIKEVRDPHHLLERMTTKQAREMHETSVAVERKHKQLISEVIVGGSLQSMCSAIVEVVDREQNKPIWLPRQTA